MTSVKLVTLSGCHPSPPIASKLGCLHFYHIILRLALASCQLGGGRFGGSQWKMTWLKMDE